MKTEILVSPEDADLAAAYKWRVPSRGRDRYYRYLSHNPDKVLILHRMIGARIAGHVLSRWELVDHINGDTLDNRRENLRITDSFGNAQNRVKNTKYRGTTLHHSGKWQAHVTHKNKMHYLGLFLSREDAALAAKNKRQELQFLSSEQTPPSPKPL